MFVLDSDHLSLLQREDAVNETLEARLSAHEETDIWVSIVSFHEQVLGWHTYLARAKTSDQMVLGYSRFESLLVAFADYQVLSFDDSAAEVFADLRKQNIRVGTMGGEKGSGLFSAQHPAGRSGKRVLTPFHR